MFKQTIKPTMAKKALTVNARERLCAKRGEDNDCHGGEDFMDLYEKDTYQCRREGPLCIPYVKKAFVDDERPESSEEETDSEDEFEDTQTHGLITEAIKEKLFKPTMKKALTVNARERLCAKRGEDNDCYGGEDFMDLYEKDIYQCRREGPKNLCIPYLKQAQTDSEDEFEDTQTHGLETTVGAPAGGAGKTRRQIKRARARRRRAAAAAAGGLSGGVATLYDATVGQLPTSTGIYNATLKQLPTATEVYDATLGELPTATEFGEAFSKRSRRNRRSRASRRNRRSKRGKTHGIKPTMAKRALTVNARERLCAKRGEDNDCYGGEDFMDLYEKDTYQCRREGPKNLCIPYVKEAFYDDLPPESSEEETDSEDEFEDTQTHGLITEGIKQKLFKPTKRQSSRKRRRRRTVPRKRNAPRVRASTVPNQYLLGADGFTVYHSRQRQTGPQRHTGKYRWHKVNIKQLGRNGLALLKKLRIQLKQNKSKASIKPVSCCGHLNKSFEEARNCHAKNLINRGVDKRKAYAIGTSLVCKYCRDRVLGADKHCKKPADQYLT